jgi:hypothetical protein
MVDVPPTLTLHYDGDRPAWRICIEKPLSFAGVPYRIKCRLFRLPQGALFGLLLNLYDIPDQPYYVHRVFDLSDPAVVRYLSACIQGCFIEGIFEPAGVDGAAVVMHATDVHQPAEDGELRIPLIEQAAGRHDEGFQCPLAIDRQAWESSLAEGQRHNASIGRLQGDQALKIFLDTFNPVCREKGVEPAWDESDRRLCTA